MRVQNMMCFYLERGPYSEKNNKQAKSPRKKKRAKQAKKGKIVQAVLASADKETCKKFDNNERINENRFQTMKA